MNIASELRILTDKVKETTKTASVTENSTALTPELIADTCQLTRVSEREQKLHDSVQQSFKSIQFSATTVDAYINHINSIQKVSAKLCDDIGKAHVKNESMRYREVIHKLNLVHLGAADGADWREGMPQAKAGKTRSWTIYLGHAAETILKCAAVAELDTYIHNTEKATCQYVKSMMASHAKGSRCLESPMSHRPDYPLGRSPCKHVLLETLEVLHTCCCMERVTNSFRGLQYDVKSLDLNLPGMCIDFHVFKNIEHALKAIEQVLWTSGHSFLCFCIAF